MAVSIIVTIGYRKIKSRMKKNKFFLPDTIPLSAELENIPDKNNFIRPSYLLNEALPTSKKNEERHSNEQSRANRYVDALLADSSAQNSKLHLDESKAIFLQHTTPSGIKWYKITSFPATLGKSQTCDVVLKEDKLIDNLHALLYEKNGKYFYLDTNSIAGSIIDDTAVSTPTEIKNNSRIEIAQTQITVFLNLDEKNITH